VTGDEYIRVLEARRDEHAAEHPPRPGFPPLLEWFIRPGDEDIVDLPAAPAPAAPRPSRPRTYRPAADLRAERDRLAAEAERVFESAGVPDRAASHGVALGHRGTARVQERNDRALARYTALTERIGRLDGRIAAAERREARATT